MRSDHSQIYSWCSKIYIVIGSILVNLQKIAYFAYIRLFRHSPS